MSFAHQVNDVFGPTPDEQAWICYLDRLGVGPQDRWMYAAPRRDLPSLHGRQCYPHPLRLPSPSRHPKHNRPLGFSVYGRPRRSTKLIHCESGDKPLTSETATDISSATK